MKYKTYAPAPVSRVTGWSALALLFPEICWSRGRHSNRLILTNSAIDGEQGGALSNATGPQDEPSSLLHLITTGLINATLLFFFVFAMSGLASAEPPPPGSYVLLSGAISGADGVKGARVALAVGGHVSMSSSIGLLMEGKIADTPKLDAGDGHTISGRLGVEVHQRVWFGSLSASYAILTTSVYTKEAWSPRLEIGRQAGPVWISGVWKGPDSTRNRAWSLGLEMEWRPGRGILRAGLGWLGHKDGGGLEVHLGIGISRQLYVRRMAR